MVNGKFQLDLSKRFPTLPRAPIVEAVLQWQAAATVEWDETTLRDKLTASFAQYEIAPQHNIETALTGSAKGLELKHSTTWEGFRLTKKEEGKPAFVCQFKQNGIVVSRLAPYKKWEQFEPEALRFWQTFVEIAEPVEIARLSTRFISQVSIDSMSEVGDYIDGAPEPPLAIGVSVNSFFHQDALNLEGLAYDVKLVRAVQPRQEGPRQEGSSPRSLIVDIDVGTTDSIAEFSELPQRLRELRFIKNEVFFALMKDAEAKFGGPTS